jgi:chromatin modification-related protein EAF6
MPENIPPPAPSSSSTGGPADVPGQPYYDKARTHLKDLLKQKANIDRSLAAMEETIFKKETEYLEDTPSGNIITGFDAYTKLAGMMMSGGGAGGSVGGYGAGGRGERRRGVVKEELRVFSRSSVTWNVNAVGLSSFLHQRPFLLSSFYIY